MPDGASVEMGTPLEHRYATTNGGRMETVAVQTFEPPIDLSNCAKVLVAVLAAEDALVLVSMQLVAEGKFENGGTDLMGMKRTEVLEFEIPAAARRLLVRAIRLSFRTAGPDSDKNARVAVERLTLVPRGPR